MLAAYRERLQQEQECKPIPTRLADFERSPWETGRRLFFLRPHICFRSPASFRPVLHRSRWRPGLMCSEPPIEAETADSTIV